MNGFGWGLAYPYSSYVWDGFHFALIPASNVASLMLADGRQRWVKLNYVVIVLGLLTRALSWLLNSAIRM
jgi:hypothetical protein